MTQIIQYQVRKDDLSTTRIVERDMPELKTGEVLLRVDHFALTANNVTYGIVGERIGYWKFFPVADEGWGDHSCLGHRRSHRIQQSGCSCGRAALWLLAHGQPSGDHAGQYQTTSIE